MKIRRFVTAETELDGVRTKVEDAVDVNMKSGGPNVNLWGFDCVPRLPIRPEDIASEYVQKGLFAPLGGLRVNLITIPPTGEDPPRVAEDPDLDLGTGGNLVEHASGGGMHRTDSIDLLLVIEGSVNLRYPRDDGGEDEIALSTGDFLVQNGVFHRWHNRSDESCTLVALIIPVERKTQP